MDRLEHDVKLSVNAFRGVAERLLEKESDKLSNMPESLSASSNASSCDDAVEMLDEATENAMSAVDAIYEIAQVCEVDVTRGRMSERFPLMASYGLDEDETKSSRLQLLIPPSLRDVLKTESQNQKCSVSQLVNDILVLALKAR
ncbi:MAG: hypothetical protein WCR02_12320 [Sphaerochaetaceae bacterium]